LLKHSIISYKAKSKNEENNYGIAGWSYRSWSNRTKPISGYQKIENAEVVAICDVIPQVLESTANYGNGIYVSKTRKRSNFQRVPRYAKIVR
jgi:hypothetical protein